MNRLSDFRCSAVRLAMVVATTAAALLLSACQFGSTGTDYFMYSSEKPEVTSIVIDKSARNMDLYNGDRRLRRYKIDLGFQPNGHKTAKGDGRTPEGTYFIDRKNPASRFYLSLGISYPNSEDRRNAAENGVDPGGDIFIHGQPTNSRQAKTGDWTAGCIAVSNSEMSTIYALVDIGTPVHIRP